MHKMLELSSNPNRGILLLIYNVSYLITDWDKTQVSHPRTLRYQYHQRSYICRINVYQCWQFYLIRFDSLTSIIKGIRSTCTKTLIIPWWCWMESSQNAPLEICAFGTWIGFIGKVIVMLYLLWNMCEAFEWYIRISLSTHGHLGIFILA